MKEDEDRKKKLEYIRIQEWEEKFDHEQKLKEQAEIRREQKLKEKELLRLKSNEDKNLDNPALPSLENFKVDKTSEN